MKEEEFYAIIKLVSGEEILSKVCPFDENDDTMVVLDNPIFVETAFVPKLGVPIAKINPWLKLSEDTMFIMSLDKIITMTECKDESLIRIHQRYVREQNKETNLTTLTPNMGYVSSISDARVSLEKLYNSETSNSKFE